MTVPGLRAGLVALREPDRSSGCGGGQPPKTENSVSIRRRKGRPADAAQLSLVRLEADFSAVFRDVDPVLNAFLDDKGFQLVSALAHVVDGIHMSGHDPGVR